MLRRYVGDPSHVISHELPEIQSDMTLEERPVEILERAERQLRRRTIPMVKVCWQHHSVEEATWECEDDVRSLYPELFVES